MELEELDLSVRTYNALRRADIKTAEEFLERFRSDSELGKKIGAKALREITTVLNKMSQQVEDTEPAETATAVVTSDDYSEAVMLTRRISANAQAMQQSLYEVCTGLTEMRDRKLYEELGYQNFADYCENEVGIRRHQAYKYADIGTMLKSENVESTQHFEAIGTEKLYLLAKLETTTRQEVVENVNIESVTVRELKAEITALQQKNEELSDRAEKAEITVNQKTHQNERLNQKVAALETQVEELENRPIEVAVSTEEAKEIETLRKVLKDTDRRWGEEYTKQSDRFTQIRREDYQKSQAELAAVKAEYEKKLAEAQKNAAPDTADVFNAYLANAIDAVKRMTAYLAEHPDNACRAQAIGFFETVMQEVNNGC